MTKVNDYQDSGVTLKTVKVAVSESCPGDIKDQKAKDLDVISPDLKNAQNGLINVEIEKADSQPNQVMVLLGLLRKLIGVKDIISLQPHIITRISIGSSSLADPDDPLDRMTNVLRWWFSKDLKYISGKLIKPYNSILGETFNCAWEVPEPQNDGTAQAYTESDAKGKVLVKCLNEQISHHPPVSGFYYCCEEKGVEARGIDHITARFSGTSFKVGPGEQNLGIFVKFAKRDNEEYQLTHPWASVNGWIKASLYATISDHAYLTCPNTKIKAIVEYKDEKWIGKPRFEVRGSIYRYDPENDTKSKLKQIPPADVLATIEGSWRSQIYIIYPDGRKRELIDLTKLEVIPKIVKPIEEQEEMESRRIWRDVTDKIIAKDFNQATKNKQMIEENQRLKAAERKSNGEEFVPQLFHIPVEGGKPQLTDRAREILNSL